METYTAATLRPILAHVLLKAQNHTLPADEVRRRMHSRMTLTDLDREVSQANIERWWQRTLDVVQGLRQRGYMLLDDPSRRFVWTLTNPVGVRWAGDVSTLESCPPPEADLSA